MEKRIKHLIIGGNGKNLCRMLYFLSLWFGKNTPLSQIPKSEFMRISKMFFGANLTDKEEVA